MTETRAWTVREALAWTSDYLSTKGDASPRTSGEWLLSAATGLTRLELYTQSERPLSSDERVRLRDGVRRRAEGEPLQYVTGEMPFRHLVVRVEPGVLIPRPETEVLVEEGLRALAGIESPRVLDLCCGSGCIALSIAYEVAIAEVWASDVSRAACECTRGNAERLRLDDRVHVVEGDLFGALDEAFRETFDLVIANPPYIPSAELESLPSEVGRFEPELALDGGVDGLDVARRIWREAVGWLGSTGTIALELHEGNARVAAEEVVECYEEVRVVPDLTGRDRVLVASAHRAGPERTEQGGAGHVKGLSR